MLFRCEECGCEQTFKEMIYDSDYDFNYCYYCKQCGNVMESNGKIHCINVEEHRDQQLNKIL